MARRTRRRESSTTDQHVSETDLDDAHSVEDEDDNDENTPANDENACLYAPVHRSSSVLALRTPLSHSRTPHDTALRDITDQFFHPPSPSPVRVSKLKRPANPIEPPRRPKKPKSLAYPADPPNWLYSRSSSSLPPSSPFPPTTTDIDHHLTDRSVGAATTAQGAYRLDTPSDPDPFGFVAVEQALRAKRVPAPHKPTLGTNAVKSPPRSTVLPLSIYRTLSQSDAPLVPTNNEDIEGLYADEPVAGPSHVHAPVAPLLMMHSDQPYVEAGSRAASLDLLRTPRKRKRRASPTPGRDLGSEEETSAPSSPSPIKVSVRGHARSDGTSAFKITRSKSKAVSPGKLPPARASRTRQVKTSYQDIPTPSSTPMSVRASSRRSTAPPTPIKLRRSTRRATVVAKAELKSTTSHEESGSGGGGRMKLRSRNAKAARETKASKSTALAKHPPSKSKSRTGTRKTGTGTAKPARGRPKGKAAKNSKGKGKGLPLENVLDLSDGTREKYERERRERLEYFKRLEGYQIQKENVYVV